jgi:hypothetical protein
MIIVDSQVHVWERTLRTVSPPGRAHHAQKPYP